MEILHIIYIGSDGFKIRNVVDSINYEKYYKPKGWIIDSDYHEIPEDPNIKELKTETKIKNYTRMKKTKPQPFDDGLIKKE